MIPLQHGLILAAILFVLGLTGLLVRRNLLFMLISLEVMINAAALAFIVAGSYWGQADGQVMYILAISLAAASAWRAQAVRKAAELRRHSGPTPMQPKFRVGCGMLNCGLRYSLSHC